MEKIENYMTDEGKRSARMVNLIRKEIPELDYCPFMGTWSMDLGFEKYLYCTPFFDNSKGIPVDMEVQHSYRKGLETVPFEFSGDEAEDVQRLVVILKKLKKKYRIIT